MLKPDFYNNMNMDGGYKPSLENFDIDISQTNRVKKSKPLSDLVVNKKSPNVEKKKHLSLIL